MNKLEDQYNFKNPDIDFIYEKTRSNLNISFNRIAFIFFIFVIVLVIFSSKVIYLGSLKKDLISKSKPLSDFRSTILDRDGNILAKTILTFNVGINPNLVIDKKKLLISLQLLFPNKDYNLIKKKIK